MIRSIRTFLLVNLLASITFVILVSAFDGLFFLYENAISNTQDELKSFSEDIQHLKCPITKSNNKTDNALIKKTDNSNNLPPKIQFEILDKNNKPIAQSEQFCLRDLHQNGFGKEILDGKIWEVYSVNDPKTGNRIIVGENYSPLHTSLSMLVKELLPILSITYLILILLVWLIVNKLFKSIQKVTNEVSKRAANNLSAIDTTMVPNEIKPMAQELNNLFAKLDFALQREKRFASDAVHELKTPLAELKTQAQVALNATEAQENERQKALKNIISSVNKYSHIIQQLLTLSRLLPEIIKNETIDLNKLAACAIAEFYNTARKKNINIELIAPTEPQLIIGNSVGINILLKNLIDNAISYIPENGEVKIIIEEHNKYIILKVIDNGPGIPQELQERVFERFYRIVGNEAPGCGLGLSIVKQIAQIHQAQIELTKPTSSGKGLEVRVIFLKKS